MREAVGSTFLFNLMIIFIFFFASFLAIAVNYSQAFQMKNRIINLLEQYEGEEGAKEKIASLIQSSGYYRVANCEADEHQITDENGRQLPGVCVKKNTNVDTGDVYYSVKTFVSFNLPVIGNFFTFPVKGETKAITNLD